MSKIKRYYLKPNKSAYELHDYSLGNTSYLGQIIDSDIAQQVINFLNDKSKKDA